MLCICNIWNRRRCLKSFYL